MKKEKITILRLDHRIERDKRITTHVALAARAFGADKIIITGDYDEKLLKTIEKVVRDWGGGFEAEYRKDHIHVIHEFKKRKAVIIHLTMYGLPLKQVIGEIRRINKEQELLIIVGGPKVENEIFHIADYNVAVTSQPHSEVSALAVFLDWLHEGKELEKEFEDARLKITPQKQGKKIIRRDEAIHNYRTYPTS